MKSLVITSICLFFSLSLFSQDVTGDWYGKADLGMAKLRITFHIEKAESGYSATMDSPDQDAYGIETDTATYKDGQLQIEVKSIGLTFQGKHLPDQEIIEGTVNQMRNAYEVTLLREPIEAELKNRPQEPKPPFEYEVREMKFENSDVGIKLAGTLTIPKGKGPFPAAVLISGSGPQDRNEELMGHKPFLVIADYFAKENIAVLRFDDRGIGESEGDFSKATSRDFADDANAAVAFLKKQKEIKQGAIGLIGHSEGGMIAPAAAARNDGVSFIISMAGTGVPGKEIILTQSADIAIAEGQPGESARENTVIIDRMLNAITSSENPEISNQRLELVLDSIYNENSEDIPDYETFKQQQMSQYSTDWMRYFLTHDPAEDWRQINSIPVLAINGSNDLQVEAETNLTAIKNALNKAGNENYTTMKIHGVNHLFQKSETGRISEYAEIEETINPSVLKLMATWINERF